MCFTDTDYKILKGVIDRNNSLKGMCKSSGTTIKEILDKTKLSDRKIRETLKKFEEAGFVEKAIKQGKADSFMLTEEGFLELQSLRTNIFGEVAKNND